MKSEPPHVGCYVFLNRPWALAVVVLLLAGAPLRAAEALWKAGVARANITPTTPLLLAGYASRDKPAEGQVMDLWIKALALEDAEGHRALVLTSDTLGVPQSIYQSVCAALKAKFGLSPEQIILSASQTHYGPVLRGALYDMYPLDDAQRYRKFGLLAHILRDNKNEH
jgi:neutral ceramidase